MVNDRDKIVQELFNVVQIKKIEIAKAEKPNWETNCVFRYNKDSSVNTNLQVCNNVEDLVNILGFLIEKKNSFDAAQKILGTKLKFQWSGFSFENWSSDLKSTVAKIEIKFKKKELEILEVRLNGLVSKEMREQLELEEIRKY
jgi:hypothetical protein